jgi:hypothetical protein
VGRETEIVYRIGKCEEMLLVDKIIGGKGATYKTYKDFVTAMQTLKQKTIEDLLRVQE